MVIYSDQYSCWRGRALYPGNMQSVYFSKVVFHLWLHNFTQGQWVILVMWTLIHNVSQNTPCAEQPRSGSLPPKLFPAFQQAFISPSRILGFAIAMAQKNEYSVTPDLTHVNGWVVIQVLRWDHQESSDDLQEFQEGLDEYVHLNSGDELWDGHRLGSH